jgi:hypothetical protein
MKSMLIAVAVVVVALCIGCAKAPQAEIDAAMKAVADAKSVVAGKYAMEQFTAVEKRLADAQTEIAKQNKTLIGRNYTAASTMLKDVVVKAAEVSTAAAAMAAQAGKDAAEATVNKTYAAYQDAVKLVRRNARATIELGAAMTSLKDAQAAMKAADYSAVAEAVKKAEEKIAAAKAIVGK